MFAGQKNGLQNLGQEYENEEKLPNQPLSARNPTNFKNK